MRAIRDIVRDDAARLDAALQLGGATARIEVQCLLQQALQVARAYLAAHPEQVLTRQQQSDYDALLQRRLQQEEPIAYILGTREFCGLSLRVTPDTLIPRPETELLVELALQRIPEQGPCRVLDLGTGSGAIALAIAQARPQAEVLAVDASAAALRIARENAASLGLQRVQFMQSDWCAALGALRFDLIVSNPPYIASGDVHLAQGDVRFEPLSALVAGTDGLDAIRSIALQAPQILEAGAWLLLEHGYDQAAAVCAVLRQQGYGDVFSARDLSGTERVSAGVRPDRV